MPPINFTAGVTLAVALLYFVAGAREAYLMNWSGVLLYWGFTIANTGVAIAMNR